MPKTAGPDPIDVHVGSRVRLRRTMQGMSQQILGDRLGLTFQQVQKYERGANRIGASRLYAISLILEVPMSYFFDDIVDENDPSPTLPGPGNGLSDNANPSDETQSLLSAYYRIDNNNVRKQLYELIRAVAMSHSRAM